MVSDAAKAALAVSLAALLVVGAAAVVLTGGDNVEPDPDEEPSTPEPTAEPDTPEPTAKPSTPESTPGDDDDSTLVSTPEPERTPPWWDVRDDPDEANNGAPSAGGSAEANVTVR